MPWHVQGCPPGRWVLMGPSSHAHHARAHAQLLLDFVHAAQAGGRAPAAPRVDALDGETVLR